MWHSCLELIGQGVKGECLVLLNKQCSVLDKLVSVASSYPRRRKISDCKTRNKEPDASASKKAIQPEEIERQRADEEEKLEAELGNNENKNSTQEQEETYEGKRKLMKHTNNLKVIFKFNSRD